MDDSNWNDGFDFDEYFKKTIPDFGELIEDNVPIQVNYDDDDDENFDFDFNNIVNDLYQNETNEIENGNNKVYKDKSEKLIERIKNELNISQQQFDEFIYRIKAKEKNKKSTYSKEVNVTQRSGNETRCTTCNRRYISLDDEAFVFENAFYFFVYGTKFSRRIVTKLHNKICSNLNLSKMKREDSRSIKQYFQRYSNISFEIIQEAIKFTTEHPEFLEEIRQDKINNQNKRKQ